MSAILRLLTPSHAPMSDRARLAWVLVCAAYGLVLDAIGLRLWQMAVVIVVGMLANRLMGELEGRP